jgi:polysaccharide deacetylase family protein (PEP-CTERM system associated)
VTRHIVTVSVEEYFQSHDLASQVRYKQWDVFESRIEPSIDRTLGFFAQHGVHATFFIAGWTAERHPGLVPRIVAAGHEVASAGYSPRRSARSTAASFRNDLRLARDLLESQGANRILGYRASHWLEPGDLWMLDVLAEEGYRYDSSINPVLRRFADHPELSRVGVHRHATGDATIVEVPISTISLAGVRVAISGGNYVRQLPHTLLKQAVRRWDARETSPMVFYFMPWELDADQPHFDAVPWLTNIRHYRGLAKTSWVLEEHFARYAFGSVAEHLGLPLETSPRVERATLAPDDTAVLPRVASPFEGVVGVTVVVPVFNEEANIAFLRRTLQRLRARLADRYRIHVIVVDDGSRDQTVARAREHFEGFGDFELIKHGRNRGIGGAIMTGIRAAGTELVCSIDCDCSYDPDILEHMLPLARDADLVTASPYHPEGRALNVPAWRIFLSRTLSRAYQQLVDVRVHTFTSCCRVHRRSVFAPMTLEHEDFLGIAEMLLRAGMQGARVVEFPATLESRMFGVSKMKTAQVIRGHLGLLRRLATKKLGGAGAGGSSP